MKKNKWMRLASLLLILCLVTTCTVSGTYAKYITVDSAVDTARVAKFGVVATADGNLFGPTYLGGENASGTVVDHPHLIVDYGVNTESVSSFDKADVVAPGVDNQQGLSLSVVGKPEVSTRLRVDAPEDGGKKYVNTDIYLKSGDYSIMVELTAADLSITKDNIGQYYSYADNTFTQLTASDTVPTTVYKRIQLTGTTASSMTADYYPIQWTVTKGTTANNKTNVSDVMDQVMTDLAGDTTGIASKYPNQAWNATDNGTTVTWKWDYGTAWKDVATDTTLPNWENTTLIDLEDTVLGQMIALAVPESGVTPTYKVASGLNEVKFAKIDADTNSANKVIVAYTGDTAPSKWDAANVACMTVSFGVRLTVTQID